MYAFLCSLSLNKCTDDAETETNDASDIDQSLSGDEAPWNEIDNETLLGDEEDDENVGGEEDDLSESENESVYAGTHQSDENSSLDLNCDDDFVDHVYD